MRVPAEVNELFHRLIDRKHGSDTRAVSGNNRKDDKTQLRVAEPVGCSQSAGSEIWSKNSHNGRIVIKGNIQVISYIRHINSMTRPANSPDLRLSADLRWKSILQS